jgi:hypothetical protein
LNRSSPSAFVIQRTVAMKPNVAKFFMIFGDFEGLALK